MHIFFSLYHCHPVDHQFARAGASNISIHPSPEILAASLYSFFPVVPHWRLFQGKGNETHHCYCIWHIEYAMESLPGSAVWAGYSQYLSWFSEREN